MPIVLLSISQMAACWTVTKHERDEGVLQNYARNDLTGRLTEVFLRL